MTSPFKPVVRTNVVSPLGLSEKGKAFFSSSDEGGGAGDGEGGGG